MSARIRERPGREPERKSRRYALGGTVAACTLAALAGSIIPLDAAPLDPLPEVVLVMRTVPPESVRPLAPAPIEPPPVEKLLSEQPSPLTVPDPLPAAPKVVEPEPAPPEPLKVKKPDPVHPEPRPEPRPELRPEPRPESARRAFPRPRPPEPRPAEPAREAEAASSAPASAAPVETASVTSSGRAAPAVERDEQRRREVLAVLMVAMEKHKRYPKQARRVGAEGSAWLAVSIGADGRVTACSLDRQGDHPLLDRATEQLGKKLVGLETPGRGAPLRVLVPVRYSLKESG